MKLLQSRKWRIFLVAWALYSVHFATNVVREHYPAFSLVKHGTFRVDEYQGFHSDIFVHRDGHSVIGNQVFVSVLAAVPLFIFNPLLDALEDYSKAKIAREGVPKAEYRVENRPNRARLWRTVTERGLELRFGAATMVTTVFFMAPLTAAFLVFFYGVLQWRGVSASDATMLTFLLGFGTPLFYRTSTLSHNLFVMYGMFVAFVLLWRASRERQIGATVLVVAGLFAGMTLATDYVAVIILPLLFAYLVLTRVRIAPPATVVRDASLFVAGTIPPILFLLYSQWAMYGNPFLPGQAWMPNQNQYVDDGMRGFTLPDPELFLMNLFDPSFGMYAWAPVLLLALLPARRYLKGSPVFPMFERRWLAAALAAFLLFVSANQYSRLQFNSGFRYLIPLVPFLILAISDHWTRLRPGIRWAIVIASLLHSWVLTVFREPVARSWQMFLEEGVQLPWYRVLGLTSDPTNPWLGTWWIPSTILTVTLVSSWILWRAGSRLEARHGH